MSALVRVLLMLLAGSWASATAAPAPDEFSRRVANYELSLARVEAYAALVAELADWTVAQPETARALQQRAPRPDAGFDATVAFIAGEPVLAAMLKRHGLSAADYVLVPAVTMQAALAALGAGQGRSFPQDRINPKNIALVQAEQARIDVLMTKIRAAQARMAGR